MKKSYTALLFAFSLTAVMTGQNKQTKKADQLFDRLEYAAAAESYEKLVKKGRADHYVYTQLGDAYYYMNDTKNAEKYYNRALKEATSDSEVVFRYAQVLRQNGKSRQANEWMERFAQQSPNDSRAQAFMKDSQYEQAILKEEAQYSLTPVKGVNSEYSDFGGFVYEGSFYFASAQNTKRKTYGWNNQPYLDIFKADIVGDHIQNPEPLQG